MACSKKISEEKYWSMENDVNFSYKEIQKMLHKMAFENDYNDYKAVWENKFDHKILQVKDLG